MCAPCLGSADHQQVLNLSGIDRCHGPFLPAAAGRCLLSCPAGYAQRRKHTSSRFLSYLSPLCAVSGPPPAVWPMSVASQQSSWLLLWHLIFCKSDYVSHLLEMPAEFPDTSLRSTGHSPPFLTPSLSPTNSIPTASLAPGKPGWFCLGTLAHGDCSPWSV